MRQWSRENAHHRPSDIYFHRSCSGPDHCPGGHYDVDNTKRYCAWAQSRFFRCTWRLCRRFCPCYLVRVRSVPHPGSISEIIWNHKIAGRHISYLFGRTVHLARVAAETKRLFFARSSDSRDKEQDRTEIFFGRICNDYLEPWNVSFLLGHLAAIYQFWWICFGKVFDAREYSCHRKTTLVFNTNRLSG